MSWSPAIAEVDEHLGRTISAGELDDWHTWWRAEVADRAVDQQLAAGSGAGQAELTIRGFDPDGLSGTRSAIRQRDGFRHLARLAAGEPIDQDDAGVTSWCRRSPTAGDRLLERAADGWWGQLMIAIREHAAVASRAGRALLPALPRARRQRRGRTAVSP